MENTLWNTSQQTSGATAQFKFEFLNKITNNFSEDHVIGDGAYGVVYKVPLLFASFTWALNFQTRQDKC
jgi:hypothetical protein